MAKSTVETSIAARPIIGIALMSVASLLLPLVDGIAKVLTASHSPFFIAWARYSTAALMVLQVHQPVLRPNVKVDDPTRPGNPHRFIKDPRTGKRVSRRNPERNEWIRTDVPELRIVDDALWQVVKAS